MQKQVIILVTTMLVAFSTSALAQTCRLSAADERIVRGLSADYRKAWLGNDAERNVMALMSESATILPHHAVKPMTGHAEIKAFWFPPNMASFQLLKLTMDPVNVDGCGDLAYVWGNQSVEWKMRESPTITFNAGTFLLVARKHANRWLIERFMWDDPPNQTR
jgi:ketosteroid isomerase-like protein